MPPRPTAIYAGEALNAYAFPSGHPFGADRLKCFMDEFRRRGLDCQADILAPVQATRAEIERFHTHEYVERVRTRSLCADGWMDQGDTPAFPGMYEAAAAVVGSALDAVHRLMAGAYQRILLPIGGLHHARRDRAAGFCLFNDCGVVIETLIRVYGLDRILYVDIDAHHGDGVYEGFEGDDRVFIVDLHEDGRYLYPGTGSAAQQGTGKARGTKCNLPLPPGADDHLFMRTWRDAADFIDRIAPQFVILQCGADSLAGDPLADLGLSAASHAFVATKLGRIAERHCHGRMLALGGGGYSCPNLAAAWNAVLEAWLVLATEGITVGRD